MNDLNEFLLARIAEAEEVAREAEAEEGGRWIATGPMSIVASFGELTDDMGAWSGLTEVRRPSITGHIALHDPVRVLADCRAKRQIVELADSMSNHRETAPEARVISHSLALVYADHPDFAEAMRAVGR